MEVGERKLADGAVCEFWLAAEQSLWIMPGAIAGMEPGWSVRTDWMDKHPRTGGVLDFVLRLWLFIIVIIRILSGGQSMLLQRLDTRKTAGRLLLAGARRGPVTKLNAQTAELWVNPERFVAAKSDATFKMQYESVYRHFNGRGAPFIRCRKAKAVWVAAYGDIVEIPIDGSGDVLVDDASLVAFSGSLAREKRPMPGATTAPLARKGWGYAFSGQGSVWVQTRTEEQTLDWLNGILQER